MEGSGAKEKEQRTVQFSYNPNKMLEVVKLGTRRAAAFVAVAKRAWAAEPIRSLEIDAPFTYKIFPDEVSAELSDQVKSNFRSWTTGNALLEIERHVSLFLDSVYRNLVILSYHNKILVNSIDERFRRFEQKNVERKILIVLEEFGHEFRILPHVSGWVNARNCLAHRAGLVGPRDCSDGEEFLQISWRRMEVLLNHEPIPHGQVRGTYVQAGASLGMRLGTTEKRIAVGKMIELSEAEILEICMTVDVLSENFIKVIDDAVRPALS